MTASSLKEPGEIRHSHVDLMVSFLEFRVHGGRDVVKDETRRQMKIVDGFNLCSNQWEATESSSG